MSLRLGMILSTDCSEHNLDHFREKYNYKFIIINNARLYKDQLNPDEMLVEPTGLYDDSDTGIGSYPYYKRNPEVEYKSVKDDNIELYKCFVNEAANRNRHYYENAVLWRKVIFEMKKEYRFSKVGIFYFGGYTTSEEMYFPILTRKVCNIDVLTPEDLMKIKENEILFFV